MPDAYNPDTFNIATFNILTMGCKVNTYDTGLLEKQLVNAGFKADAKNARIQIVNSCAVTETSALDTQKHIRKLKKIFPDAVVVVTGCVAQVDAERLKAVTGADLIVGNSHKGHLDSILRDHLSQKNLERVFHSNIFKKDELDEGGGIESSRTRAFLKIQDGCNSFCSFCIIPFARGKSRSLAKDHLIARVNELHAKGFQEVVLTGVHCGDYEDESSGTRIDYAGLVESVLHETAIPRVRLSSLEPIEVNDHLWRLFREDERLCRHLHVSLQSGNTSVLKNMRRKYGQLEIKMFFEKLRDVMPDAFVGMDVIAGFPGESEEDFIDTYDFLKRQPWTRMHVFPYSIRPGTTAEKHEDHLKEHVIHLRARQLRALSLERQTEQAARQIGKMKDVLILENPSRASQGLSRDYWPVQIENFDHLAHVNEEMRVEITGSRTSGNSEAVLTARVAKAL